MQMQQAPNRNQALFSPQSFLLREKRLGRRRQKKKHPIPERLVSIVKKWQKILLLVLAFAVAILGSSIVTMQLLTRGGTPAEDKAAEVSAYLDCFFIDDYDEDALADAAAAAMVEATGDRWSYYLTAEEKSSYDEQMQNAYVGIGVTITLQEQDGGMRVEQVTAGGPAEEAGMQVGDIITEVEGESTLTLGMTGTRAKVRGEEGTSVALTILRGGERLTLTVERRSIETAVATYEMLDGQIGYVKIANFDTRCFDETSAAIDALLDDIAAGRKYMKVYKQMKMYNDPELNPVLYASK